MQESDGGITEIRFVPDNKLLLDSMFTTMSECQVRDLISFFSMQSLLLQALHPDPVDSDEDIAGEEEDAEEPGMFDDAEEEDAGENNGTEQMDAD